jgi:uncharacterized caspase-like protein
MSSYAEKDANDFVAALQRQVGSAYTSVTPKIITADKASLAGIRDGLAWLVKNAQKGDIGILFLAGHGVDDRDGTYYYIPQGGDLSRLSKTAVPRRELQAALNGMGGFSILFIDTCHAANVVGQLEPVSMDVNGLVNRIRKPIKGVIVYASSSGNLDSQESRLWRNGAFTKAVVEGLDGGARSLNRDYITPSMLNPFIRNTVSDLTGGLQQATASIPQDFPDLWMARITH